MEQIRQKYPLRLKQTVCDEFEERATDMDIILPDYCPEIAVVLKCIMTPHISRCFQSGDRYAVDGITQIRILYLSEDRSELHCHETTEPFSVVFHVGDAVHYEVDAKTDYVNCRAVSARRLDVHGAFRVYLHAVGCAEITTVAPHIHRHICYKTMPVSTEVPLMQVNKSFSITENIPLDADVQRMIYNDCYVTDCEYKLLANKVIVKGRLKLRMMSVKNDHIAEVVEMIPFSQIVDAEGVSDDWLCRISVTIGEKDIFAQIHDAGPSAVSVNIKLMTCVYLSNIENTEIVLDAYSVQCPLLCETMNVTFPNKQPVRTEREMVPLCVTLPENTHSLIDVWGTVRCDEKPDHIVTTGYLITAIIRDHEGHISCFESTVDEVLALEANTSLNMRVIGMKGMISADQLHIQVDVEKQLQSEQAQSVSVATELIEDKQTPFDKAGAAIRIVYADKGDSVWDIAKEHHAVVDDILQENDLKIDTIGVPTVLIIPV